MTKSLVLCKVITNFSILFYFFQEPTLDSNGVEIKEPLDTIFVKSVRESGPAHLAGLQCGKYFVFKPKFVSRHTPPRTPRISGLKSQVLKPTFMS